MLFFYRKDILILSLLFPINTRQLICLYIATSSDDGEAGDSGYALYYFQLVIWLVISQYIIFSLFHALCFVNEELLGKLKLRCLLIADNSLWLLTHGTSLSHNK